MSPDPPQGQAPELTPEITNELETLARAHFPARTFSAAELKLLRAAPLGEMAVCGPNDNWDDPRNDPSKADAWGEDRQIRADLIRWLCLDRQAKEVVDPKGIQIYGAKVPNELDLSYATVPFGITLRKCRLFSELNLRGSSIPQLYLQGSRTMSIAAENAKFAIRVVLRDGCNVEGEVRLLDAQIGGPLDCSKGTFKKANGIALNADRISVKGGVFLRQGFNAEGEVRLAGAQIGGQLSCAGGMFNNAGGDALNADGVNVRGDVFLTDEFRAKGEVRLVGAEIGGQFGCVGGTFENANGFALNADGINVKGGIFLSDKFCADGTVRLVGAQVDAQVACDGAELKGAFEALALYSKADLRLTGLVNAKASRINLSNACVNTFVDDPQSWPASVNLDGFVYQRIARASGDHSDSKNRLKWLKLQEHFTLQPYRQLAKVLREEGDIDGAKRVLVEMERRRRNSTWWLRVRSAISRWTVGYGYHPLLALAWLGLLWLLGFGFFYFGYSNHAMTPTDNDAYTHFEQHGNPPAHYERFSASIYSLENSLPLVKLGQADRWHPDPSNDPAAKASASGIAGRIASPPFLRFFLRFQILFGWFLASMFAAGVTGIVHKD